MDRILEWIAENPVYAGVIIAAAVIIVVLVILLIVHAARKSKRNKEKQELSESAAMQNGTDAQANASDPGARNNTLSRWAPEWFSSSKSTFR